MDISPQISKLIQNPVCFLSDSPAAGDGIAISSRIRLARNIEGYPFPGNAPEALKKEIASLVRSAAVKSRMFPARSSYFIFPEELSESELAILVERRLASTGFVKNPQGALLIASRDEKSSIMVNEEDQLRIQCMTPGFDLDSLWEKISGIDDKLNTYLEYACDEKYGFLTSCPSNIGTGMRASVMLHLPGLVATGLINPTLEGINQLHLAVRGLRGEGSKNHGNFFQISNQYTLGITEKEAVSALTAAIVKLIDGEKQARERLFESNRNMLFDKVGRAYGTLKYSYHLPLDEAFYALSCIRLGVDMGMFNAIDIATVNRMQIALQPGHLGCQIENSCTSDDCDERRAFLCRTLLKSGIKKG